MIRHAFIEAARADIDLAPAENYTRVGVQRAACIDRLAAHLRESLDMKLVKSWIISPSVPRGRP